MNTNKMKHKTGDIIMVDNEAYMVTNKFEKGGIEYFVMARDSKHEEEVNELTALLDNQDGHK